MLNRDLARLVARRLQAWWSPDKIAGWLKRTYPDDERYPVSHETIFRSLFIQARGALKKELLGYLRRSRVMRRSRHHTQKTPDHGQILDALSVRERPAEVEDWAVPGHWEGDLLCGGRDSQIATLVEHESRYVMLVKVPSKHSQTSTLEVINDRGVEHINHIDLDVLTRSEERYSSCNDDFDSVRGESRWEWGPRRGTWSIRTVTHTILTSDAHNFQLHATLDAHEGERRVYCRTWNRVIPRKLL